MGGESLGCGAGADEGDVDGERGVSEGQEGDGLTYSGRLLAPSLD